VNAALTVAEAIRADADEAREHDAAVLAGARSWSCKTLRIAETRGGAVQFSVGGSTEAFSPEGALRAATAAVTLALPPDVSLVAELAEVVHAAHCGNGCSIGPASADWQIARSLAALGYRRETGRG
jgi:hypothetical protein